YERTGKVYSGSTKYDNSKIKANLIDEARHSYHLPNQAIVDILEKFFEQDLEFEERFPFWKLKDFIRCYYNENMRIYEHWKSVDDYLSVVPRQHLVLESGESLRKDIARFMISEVRDGRV